MSEKVEMATLFKKEVKGTKVIDNNHKKNENDPKLYYKHQNGELCREIVLSGLKLLKKTVLI